MNILITGANGSLGEKLRVDLEALNYKVICASSNPSSGQKNFNLNSGFDSDLLEDIDLILHLAINPKLVLTNIEREFLQLAASQSIILLYLGSTSSYLVKPNKYGIYKKLVEDLVTKNNGVVLTCGLLYGSGFHGQVSKIKKYLKVLPFNIELLESKFVYLTPVKAIVNFLMKSKDKEKFRGKRLLLCHFEAVLFNQLLTRLVGKKVFKVKFSKKDLDLFIKINPFKTRYFSLDSYMALFSDFKSDLIHSSIDLRHEVERNMESKLF
jgi:nucleoside-diphosphate-sugar epimerase